MMSFDAELDAVWSDPNAIPSGESVQNFRSMDCPSHTLLIMES